MHDSLCTTLYLMQIRVCFFFTAAVTLGHERMVQSKDETYDRVSVCRVLEALVSDLTVKL